MERSRSLPLLTLSDWHTQEQLQLQTQISHSLKFRQNNDDNPFIHAMQNILVVEHLAEYLFMEDLKALTLVSRDCLNSIRSTKSFSTRARFTIISKRERNAFLDLDNYEGIDIAASLHVLQGSTYQWKNLSIQLGVPGLLTGDAISEMEQCLESAESVLFWTSRRGDNYNVPYDDFKGPEEWLQFEPVLQRMENLRELEIHSKCEILLNKVFRWGDVLQQIFSKVESLKIEAGCSYHPNFLSHDCHIRRLMSEGISQPRRYSHLKKFCAKLLNCVNDQVRTDHCASIVKIVDLKKDTLEELQFHDDVFRVQEMKTIRLPNLKRLLLKIDYLESSNVAKAFLQNQVPLEELRISRRGFPVDLLQWLDEADKLGKLQKLCIQTDDCIPPKLYIFLKRMRKLKVVHLIHSPCECNPSWSYKYCPTLFGRVELQKSYPQIRFNKCTGFGSSCFDFGCVFNLMGYRKLLDRLDSLALEVA